jgi:hypothetical protein
MLLDPDNFRKRFPLWARSVGSWLVVVTSCCGVARAGSDAARQFEAALYSEVVAGDLAKAMTEYRAITREAGVYREVAAKALLQTGICQEKLGQRKEAYATYTRVVSEYGDQNEIVKKAQIRLAVWSGPRNLRFEEGVAGKAPPGWFVPSLPKDADYMAELRRDQCRSRSGCAMVVAPANVPRPVGNLMQSFSAAAYAGKLVRLRAWLRLEPFFFSPLSGLRVPDPEDRAQLWLSVERTNRRRGFSENMDERPVRSTEWTETEIVGEVDKDAQFINFGVLSIGGARVWVDDVSFEVVSKH